jgi:hypothetical protein
MERQLVGSQPLKPFCWLLLVTLGLGCDAWELPRKQFGLVAYYPFNGNALDAGGNNLHGVMKNGATYGVDRDSNGNSALFLDGIDDYFEIPDNALLRPAAAFSISVWIKPKLVASSAQIYAKSVFTGNLNNQYTARITPPYTSGATSGNEFITEVEQDGDCNKEEKGKKQVLYFAPDYQLNQWVHVVTVFEGKTGKFYLNGEKKMTVSEFRDIPIDNCAGGPLRFGAAWDGDVNIFTGFMDEIRFYNRALTDSEIKALHQL